MKAIVQIGMWKAIAFLTVVISIFSCTSCDPDLNLKPQITIGTAENVSQTSATLVASVIPNGDNVVVSFEYQANNSAWKSQTLTSKVSGSKAIKVTLDLSDLQPSTLYNFRVTAGSSISSVSSFTTKGLILAVIKIKSAENVKISTASLSASVVPNQDNTSISFEYQANNSAWVSKSLGSTFSGSDSTKVNLDLSDLQANTLYNFRVRVSNKAGEVVSDIASFTTYAVSDYDGNLYHTVTIGTQTWLRENLKTTHYANGDPIPNVTDTTAWLHSTSGAYVYYNNDPKLGEVYGALYNWYVTNDSRGLIVGYHVPIGREWGTLENFIRAQNSGSAISGFAMMERGTSHWISSAGTNSTGFTALPNGECGISNVTYKWEFMDLGNIATFWCSDSLGEDSEIAQINPSRISMLVIGIMYSKKYGYGIRLLKN